ncbi:MAG: hypothetical protein ACFB4J_01310 [Elainellaceae cyanobacterium]
MQPSSVELSVEINGEGQVNIVGNGGKIANTGGITLKFTRCPKFRCRDTCSLTS